MAGNAKEKRYKTMTHTRPPISRTETTGALPRRNADPPPSVYYGNFLGEEFFGGRKTIRYRFLPILPSLRSVPANMGRSSSRFSVSGSFFKRFDEKKQLSLSGEHGFFDSSRENKEERERERDRYKGYNCASSWSLSG